MVRITNENWKRGELRKRPKFCINNHMDLLIEIMKRLDGRSLTTAACVCRQWRSIARNDALWEHLCFRHVSPPPLAVKPVVVALGGYRRLYMICVRPVLVIRLKQRRIVDEVGGDSPASSLKFLYKAVDCEFGNAFGMTS